MPEKGGLARGASVSNVPGGVAVNNSNSLPLDLRAPVHTLWGVGPERSAQLARINVRVIGDLLLCRPRAYEDRRQVRKIAELLPGESVGVQGHIVALGVKYYQKRSRSVFELVLQDETGRLYCRWWQQPYLENKFKVGEQLWVFGKTKLLKPATMDQPEVETIDGAEDENVHSHRIVPVYGLTEGLTQRWLRGLIWRTLRLCDGRLAEPWKGLDFQGHLPFAEAVKELHFPNELSHVERARARLAIEELLHLQCAIQKRRRKLSVKTAWPCGGDNRLIRPFLRDLGFRLTAAQTRVLRELRRDLSGKSPMRRLLQGDVGSGKTVVAACCAFMAVESGFDVALMAPTEILAEQHFQNFTSWCGRLQVKVELRTGSRITANDVRSNAPGAIYIGTHALLEEAFEAPRLGLVVIDEQHKFGVAQRERLVRKGQYPHVLVMTATPIPRTLALTMYGDLDVSLIDEMPGGRSTIRTFVRGLEQLPKVWEFLKQKVGEGRQAYIVYPRLEEDDPSQGLKALLQERERVSAALGGCHLGLVHGRLKAREKDTVMASFRANQLQVLMATSIIEVGVDVPNATVMVIENADHFGLAQLHQLRGRIGRGSHESFCILVHRQKARPGRQRLRVLEETTDGFQIAEADLRARGPGELLGKEQSGLPDFRFVDLATDLPLVQLAQKLARDVLDEEPGDPSSPVADKRATSPEGRG